LDYQQVDAVAQIQLGVKWQVRPTDELMRRLDGLVGRGSVRVEY